MPLSQTRLFQYSRGIDGRTLAQAKQTRVVADPRVGFPSIDGLTARDRESIDSGAKMLAAIHRRAEMRD